ncbi:unnamed protein product [Bursaphelenchus xylophilus]|uniref:(pine wood nematode) hypothetical protein n=1 Tax=Bursaphelenchus xylophilus TaxID=6326 RepID=A0A1I7SBB9_BURXY|nr:unnamed protein product [Bursaphelenchus xylophilus]CAG9131976.1 unnamed protein product [Bursaphelenchus xylophilus]
MPKQDFELIDYLGPVVVAIIFAICLLLISFTVINWYCITHRDDLTVFEKLGRRADIRLGPHKMSVIRRGGYASTYAKDEEALMKKQSHAAQVALASEIA